MEKNFLHYKDCFARISAFNHEQGTEFAAFIQPSKTGTFDEQLSNVNLYLNKLSEVWDIEPNDLRFSRFYLSDILNQKDLILESNLFNVLSENSCVSFIQQAPLTDSKFVLFIRATKEDYIEKTITDNALSVKKTDYSEHWSASFGKPREEGSCRQTGEHFETLEQSLKNHNANVADNCMRTWFYVSDIDKNYDGMVTARNDFFEKIGLSPSTHFIASTGIEGKSFHRDRIVSMEAYCLPGIKKEQIRYLNAFSHLNSTHEYGVSFERAVEIQFPSHKQISVSGTASINNKGEIVHCNDVAKQFDRAMENIESLLKDADAGFKDVLYFIVYLRDLNDAELVKKRFESQFDAPYIITLAPVCRPGWLIEIECEAVR